MKSNPFDPNETIQRLMIFGHPAHELAIFGAIQRFRPELIIVTDGGSAERETYTRQGLEGIGLTGKVDYLRYREHDFYQALLDRDTDYFDVVILALREKICQLKPDQIFCDAIEYYNPVHDIIAILVDAARQGMQNIPVFRVPLVYQISGSDDYEIQRVPSALSNRCATLTLSDVEVARKCKARDEIYLNLRDQAGGDFMGLSPRHAAREEVELHGPIQLLPGQDGRRLRYEWRANLLQEQGSVERVITFEDHFLPLFQHYLGNAQPI
jgi:hypothetical protein